MMWGHVRAYRVICVLVVLASWTGLASAEEQAAKRRSFSFSDVPLLVPWLFYYHYTYERIEKCYHAQTAESLRGAIRQFLKSCSLPKCDMDYFEEQADHEDRLMSEYLARVVARSHPARYQCNDLEWREEDVSTMEDMKDSIDRFGRGEISAAEALQAKCEDFYKNRLNWPVCRELWDAPPDRSPDR